MGLFVLLLGLAFGGTTVPGWVGLVGLAVLYAGLALEHRAVAAVLADIEGPTPRGARSMLLTRLMLVALSLPLLAAFVARLGA